MARKRKSSGNKDNMVPNKEHSDCANPLTEKVDALVEKVNSQPIKEANTTKSYSQTKKMKYQVATVRRSGRINNTVVTAQNQDIELVTEEVILGESQKEDGQVNVEKQLPRLTTEEKGMEEKIDYISRLLEAQGKNMEEMISKEPRRDSGSNSRNKGYKGLYITSQNKVDALTKENHRLLLKLENALAKLEGYEKGTRVATEWMQSLRDITLISNVSVTRRTEKAICNALSSQARGRKTREKK